jgi:flagellar biosynthesis component FlhA
MLEMLYAPVQFAFRWMDEHPGMRMAFALALFALAIFAPIPGAALDLWLVLAVGSAATMSMLLVVVGSDLDPREAITGLPGFLRRFAFHRLALAIALTKAILLGHPLGQFMNWLADHGLGNSVGVGLAVVSAIYAGRFAAAHFPQFDRLTQAAARLPVEYSRLEHAVASGRLSPSAARRSRQALAQEIQLLADARQIFRLLRFEAVGSLAVAVSLVAAGIMTGLWFKEWPLALTLSTITLYSLAEAIFTSLPGLLFSVTLSQWMGSALETSPFSQTGTAAEDAPDQAPMPLMAIEVGRELAPIMRRVFPERVAIVRTTLAQELGFHLPRVDLISLSGLPPRGYRLTIRGVAMSVGTLGPLEAADLLGIEIEQAARTQAASLLTLDSTQALLDELSVEYPVAVAQALERLGLPVLHGVFLGLLREQIGLRDLAGLVDALVGLADISTSVPVLVEHARRALAPQIGQRLADARGVITALELDSNWDEELASMPSGFYAATGERAIAQDLQSACREAVERLVAYGVRPALIVPRRFRPLVAEALAPAVPRLSVLAPDELAPRFEVRLVGRVERPALIRAEAPSLSSRTASVFEMPAQNPLP